MPVILVVTRNNCDIPEPERLAFALYGAPGFFKDLLSNCHLDISPRETILMTGIDPPRVDITFTIVHQND